jgi:excisionase family DNA binding protein
MTEQIGITEAARLTALGASTLRRWAANGTITATQVEGEWRIQKESLLAHLTTLKPPKSTFSNTHPTSEAAGESEAYRIALSSLERERSLADALRHELSDVRAENRALQAEVKALLAGNLESALSQWHRTPSTPPKPETTGEPPESSNKIPENQDIEPKTEFGKQCYQLFKSGKSDEEIASTLHKPLQNIRMTLRKYRHNT